MYDNQKTPKTGIKTSVLIKFEKVKTAAQKSLRERIWWRTLWRGWKWVSVQYSMCVKAGNIYWRTRRPVQYAKNHIPGEAKFIQSVKKDNNFNVFFTEYQKNVTPVCVKMFSLKQQLIFSKTYFCDTISLKYLMKFRF